MDLRRVSEGEVLLAGFKVRIYLLEDGKRIVEVEDVQKFLMAIYRGEVDVGLVADEMRLLGESLEPVEKAS